jgi:hypothetical protein
VLYIAQSSTPTRVLLRPADSSIGEGYMYHPTLPWRLADYWSTSGYTLIHDTTQNGVTTLSLYEGERIATMIIIANKNTQPPMVENIMIL